MHYLLQKQDDPDVWALITIFGGSTVYMLYNIRCVPLMAFDR